MLLVTLPECQSPTIKKDFECSAQHVAEIPDFQTVPGRDCLWPERLMLMPWHGGLWKNPERETHLQSQNTFVVSKHLIFPSCRCRFPQEHPSWIYKTQRVAFYLFWHFHTAPQIIFFLHGMTVAGQLVRCQPGPHINWDRYITFWIPPSPSESQEPLQHPSLFFFPSYTIN